MKTAPPPARAVTRAMPPYRSASRRTSARPSPRPRCAGDCFVVQPSAKIRSRASGGTPGPSSDTRSTTVVPSARSSTSTSERAASRALSMRLPSTVTRSRGSTTRSGSKVAGETDRLAPRSAAIADLPTSRADNSGSLTRSATCSAEARWASATSPTKSTASSYRPSSSSPSRVCSRLACSWSWARSASSSPCVLSSSRPSRSSSVRSRRVATAPPSPVGIRLATSTRDPLTVSRSVPATRPASTSVVRPGGSTSSSARPEASGPRPSSRCASSLSSRTLPWASRAMTPSRMPCSIASRSSSSAEMSAKARPCVLRCSRRDTRSAATTPTPSAAPAYSSSTGTVASSRSRTLSYAMPTDTAPTILPPAPCSGTLARAERPRVPRSICMISRPERATLGSVETCRPIWVTSVCDQRTPRVSMTTMWRAPVARRIRSASSCTGPVTLGRVLTRSWASPGVAAVVWAIDSACRIACWSSWELSGARNSPVARVITPVVRATWTSSTWAKTRRGQRIRIDVTPALPGVPRPCGIRSSVCPAVNAT